MGTDRGRGSRRRRELGATAVEYAMFAALIAAVIVAAVLAVGQSTLRNVDCTGQSIETRTAACGASSPGGGPTDGHDPDAPDEPEAPDDPGGNGHPGKGKGPPDCVPNCGKRPVD
jgi:Flp pilus assembly pilin Flp